MAWAVLRKYPDGTHGLLNIFEASESHAQRDAERAAQGWRSFMPTEHIYVKQVPRLNKCLPVNNIDGFI